MRDFYDHLYRWSSYLIEFRDKNRKETVGFYLEAFGLVCEAHIYKNPHLSLSLSNLILKISASFRTGGTGVDPDRLHRFTENGQMFYDK